MRIETYATWVTKTKLYIGLPAQWCILLQLFNVGNPDVMYLKKSWPQIYKYNILSTNWLMSMFKSNLIDLKRSYSSEMSQDYNVEFQLIPNESNRLHTVSKCFI